MTELKTVLPSVSVRSVVEADLVPLTSLGNNYEIWKFMRDDFPHPYLAQNAEREFESKWRHAPDSQFVICESNRVVGRIYYDRQSDIRANSASLGYWIGQPYWGRGIATACIRSVSDYVLRETGIVRLYARVLAHNRGSIRSLEKCGFVIEGYFSCAVTKEGQLHDQLEYALVNNERRRVAHGIVVQHDSATPPLDLDLTSVSIRVGKHISSERIADLFQRVGWRIASRSSEVSALLPNCDSVVSLWDDDRLIGFANALSDGGHAAYIHFVVIDPAYRRRGFGKLMVTTMVEQLSSCRHLVLVSSHESVGFFRRCGFVPAAGALAMEVRRLGRDSTEK